jgi:anti-sigma factor RsiW
MTPDCRWTKPRIIAYVDGELDEPDEELVNEHLSA